MDPVEGDLNEHRPWENYANAYRCHVDVYLFSSTWGMEALRHYASAQLELLRKTKKPFAGRLDDLLI